MKSGSLKLAAAAGLLAIALTALAAAAPAKNPFLGLKFRNLGPAIAGGRVAAVAGVPGNPNIYYVGSAGGGVWKTEDGGLSWQAIFTKQPTGSIGAIALAPSNPNLVWVGTGEGNPRNDVTTGAGIFFSADGGAHWTFKGLGTVGQITRIVINPQDPNDVLVAALGHVWAPNPQRGVYRTTDGGATWKKVLFVNDHTGCSDLIMDPGNPMVLFAGMWEFKRFPWILESGGKASGIFRSTDGGATWQRLHAGLPTGLVGRIGLAAAPSRPNLIYALIESRKGTLWASSDLGSHWHLVSHNHLLDVRPFYFSHLAVAPDNANRVYFVAMNMSESNDGGRTARVIAQGVHVDYHAIWIDPANANRVLVGNDGGAYLSTDAGAHFRYFNNLPIEQFYQVAADTRNPYHLCGGLQDNNAWCGISHNLSGFDIGPSNWYTVAGGDGQYVVPAPSNPRIIYAEAQNGYASRINLKTGASRYIRPSMRGVSQESPAKLRYRFNWTTPIAVSATNPNIVYMGANVLLRSTDGGLNWKAISPDLTRNDKTKQQTSGGPIDYDISGAETYDTILSIGISPLNPNLIWVGTDDGQVQYTRNGGRTWTNVAANLSGVGPWGRISQIEPSPFAAGTCYLAVDRHELDDNHPYVFRTTDFGHTWQAIDAGLPADASAHVLREDPLRRGFLVLGTDTGLYYSFNHGDQWQRFPLANFPTTPVYDLKFVPAAHALVVATHGRGLFVLDNLIPFEHWSDAVAASKLTLFPAAKVTLFRGFRRSGFEEPGSFTTPNPPAGAVLTYYLKTALKPTPAERKKHHSPVRIVITNAAGQTIKTLYGPAKAGVNQFVWGVNYSGPKPLRLQPPRRRPGGGGGFFRSFGPPAGPGLYHVAVTAAGVTEKTTVRVVPDPRLPFHPAAFQADLRTALELRDDISAMNQALNRMHSLRLQLAAASNLLGSEGAKYQPLLHQAGLLGKKIAKLQDTLYNPHVQRNVGEDDIHYLTAFHGQYQRLMFGVFNYDRPPAPNELAAIRRMRPQLEGYLNQFNQILKTDVVAFNHLAIKSGATTLFAGAPIQLKKANATVAALTSASPQR